MASGAPKIIKAVKKKYPSIDIKKECGKNMIELGTDPHTDIPNVIEKVIKDLEKVLEVADSLGYYLYPFSTYPGAFDPEFNKDPLYDIKEKIFGKDKWPIAARCVGLHCHYTLPWGVFDEDKKTIKNLVRSKNKQSLINIYNIFIAMDPALLALTQSSPFYQAKYYGKDSRAIFYRGGRVLKNPDGLYAKLPKYGALQRYKYTLTDLMFIIKNRHRNWLRKIQKTGANPKEVSKHGSILDTAWNPVKINAHGTVEQRGMDMNLPSVIAAIGLVIKYVGKLVQEDFMHVFPSEIGIEEPFSVEKNIIYIPPHITVRLNYQRKAAYKGLESNTIHEYTSALIKLAKRKMPEDRYHLLKPLEDMLETKNTTSDSILERAKELGYKPKTELTREQAAKLALKNIKHFREDIKATKKALKQIKTE